jgi:hypothetical protein
VWWRYFRLVVLCARNSVPELAQDRLPGDRVGDRGPACYRLEANPMIDQPKPPRPDLGSTIVREIRIFVCVECGFVIKDGDACTYGCAHDCVDIAMRPVGSVIVAKWKRTDVFMGDEPFTKETK